MTHLIRFLLILAITIIMGSACNMTISEDFVSTIYQVSGIIFSIGMGLIVSFNINNIKNRTYIKKIRKNIKQIQNLFMVYFAIATVLFYLFYNEIKPLTLISKYKIIFDSQLFITLSIAFSIVYFIMNFIEIQGLNDEIFDRANDELEKQ